MTLAPVTLYVRELRYEPKNWKYKEEKKMKLCICEIYASMGACTQIIFSLVVAKLCPFMFIMFIFLFVTFFLVCTEKLN